MEEVDIKDELATARYAIRQYQKLAMEQELTIVSLEQKITELQYKLKVSEFIKLGE